ncbi:MAG: hypothetical protein STSR0008_19580 [Ignavibacterium sp.]
MNETNTILQNIIDDFSNDNLIDLFRNKSNKFRPINEEADNYDNDFFSDGLFLGEIELENNEELIISTFKVQTQNFASQRLTERSGKKAQYELAKKILKQEQRYAAGFFIFYDDNGNFRLSLIYDIPQPNGKREWSSFRRFTYYVSKDKPNKTFRLQIDKADFSSLSSIQKAFSIEAVTDYFYKEFKPNFDKLAASISAAKTNSLKQDFALLFIIRIIFLGFVQKKLWLNSDEEFIQNFLKEYKEKYQDKNAFYDEWLRPLFFESLNNPPGRKVFNRTTPFSKKTSLALQMAPYLNGELFKEKTGVDDQDLSIPDKAIEQFFDFLFSYNFTIEENTLYDQDLELNPEFLGIIFERLVNKEDGAVYTPRTEVDFMCRISLVKWLEKNSSVTKKKLYHLFFDKQNDNAADDLLNLQEKEQILSLLKNVTICDPAAGSGAFPVGMLQVLDETIQLLSLDVKTQDIASRNAFERKKEIISRSLYGVEVKAWAVWINQLRLWLSLFIDMPDEFNKSFEPLLPNLEFKICRGDSLVQKIGSKIFTVGSQANLSPQLKRKVTELKKEKSDFFYGRNKLGSDYIRKKENTIFKEIIEEQILEKKRTLSRQVGIGGNGSNPDMFGIVTKIEELRLQMDERKKEQLFEEVKNLEEELKSFKDEHPLVWNIEFAEIFYDKNGFDIIIGNPPYVRQEKITDPNKKYDAAEYKELLRNTIYEEFPDYFYKDKQKSKLKNKIDGKSDLYTFFYLKSLKLLNENGVHTFICSNSWLDVGYGKWLQQFILDNAKLHFVIDNQSKRSFSSSDVNTIITVIGSPNKYTDEQHKAKFIVFKRPFEEILNTENLLLNEYAETITKDDDFRVYPITYKELKEAGTVYENENDKKLDIGTYEGDKWGGKYLRAPDIFFTILEKGKDKLVRLGDIAEVRFGIKTGANEFFYLDEEKIKQWGIEEEFLKPVIKSPRECKKILVNPKDLRYKIFMCNKEKKELKNTNALKYIDWGEGEGFNNNPTCASRNYWWWLPEIESKVFMQMSYNDVFKFWFSERNLKCDARLYTISLQKKKDAYLLNNTLSTLFIEMYGRANLGEGALDFKVYEAENILVFNSEIIFKIDKKGIDKFINREIKSVFIELGFDKTKPIRTQKPNPLPDRKALDDIIFDALGLSKAEREEVYYSVCELVQNRLNKARSV